MNGPTVSGVKDAAGKPFWFDGKVPSLGFNPQLFAPSGASTYDGTQRIETGLPLGGPPKPLTVTFTKPGTYTYFCDVHPGMVGTVVVEPAGSSAPSTSQQASAVKAQVKAALHAAKKLAPAPPQQALYPSSPRQPIHLSRQSHGNRFANTGVLDRDRSTPVPASREIKFTQPGTYLYVCLIHPFMRRVVVVTK